MYAIVHSIGSSFKYKKVLFFILLIPLILSLCFMPWQNYSIQLEMISYFLWTTAYDLCAALISSLFPSIASNEFFWQENIAQLLLLHADINLVKKISTKEEALSAEL